MDAFEILNGRFRLLRKLARRNQAEVAKLAGLSLSTIQKTEREGNQLAAESVLKVLKSYNIDPRDADEDFFHVDPANRLRPGKKHQRDKHFGIDDSDFWHWLHREGKDAYGGRDMTAEDDPPGIYRDWEDAGCP